MSPDPNIPPNTPISDSSQNPDSIAPITSPEAQNAPLGASDPISLNNDNPPNEPISIPSPEEARPEELPAEGGKAEGVSESAQTSETRTAQIPVNEPLASEPEPLKTEPQTFSQPKTSLARELLIKARNAIQFRKRKKLDKVMTMFLKKSKITNDEVEKFLHVSDATAERYLNTLEKENKIKQVGKTGHAVTYLKM
jgi:hypothetical protein